VDVAVIGLPHIANFDDFDPLAREPGVAVRYVRRPGDLGLPDLIVLPGTKTTVADLGWLRERGLADAIVARVRRGTLAAGICGGYQMLGHTIEDPHGVESAPGTVVEGLGVLPVRTVFELEKATHQVQARVLRATGLLAGCAGYTLTGYEIHMGQTIALGGAAAAVAPAFALQRLSRDAIVDDRLPAPYVAQSAGGGGEQGTEQMDGVLSADGAVLGTYLHGLFENAGLRRTLLRNVATARGMAGAPEAAAWGHLATLDEQFDRLAAAVRGSIDLRRVRALAGLA
jgi:adenosylcobyric acid synthase